MRIFLAIAGIIVLVGISYGQESVSVLTFNEFEPRLHHTADTLYLVNFWATWCIPCRKEMPAIQHLSDEFGDKPLKVLLVSLDSPTKLETTLYPYLAEIENVYEVIVLNSPDFNNWIDKVDSTWSGAIPATLMYSPQNRQLFERSFEQEELYLIVKSALSQIEHNK